MAMTSDTWVQTNQHYPSTALAGIKNTLEIHIARLRGISTSEEQLQEQGHAFAGKLDAIAATLSTPSALTKLCNVLELSPFERDILLLCAGMELDGAFIALVAATQGYFSQNGNNETIAQKGIIAPTFRLALEALPHAHWDALTPAAPLRRWQLIEVNPGNALTLSSLRIDEVILHYLAGTPYIDKRLSNMIEPSRIPSATMVPSHQQIMKRLVAAWSHISDKVQNSSSSEPQKTPSLPVLQLYGEDRAGKHAIATATCAELGLSLSVLYAEALPLNLAEIAAFICLWERTAMLTNSALLIDCEELDVSEPARNNAIARLMHQMVCPLIITSPERLRQLSYIHNPTIAFEVHKPLSSEQRMVWQNALGDLHLNGQIDMLVSQFNLSTSAIHSASSLTLGRTNGEEGGASPPLRQEDGQGKIPDTLETLLWQTCRVQARPALENLAQRIESNASWDDLILPEAQLQILRDAVAHVRQRATVYETWGFNTLGTRGLGISALFAGPSGTGKTLAAEVLAHELQLDLYHIDLSAIVSKYIGETEKNLRRIFDAAEEGGAILLFDEADAIFGKRSEVKDSHDRYANIEVSYLLQRMESYRGLAIMTTNLKSALDTAFLRRIRFIIQFPFPNKEQRAAIWRHIFPAQMPAKDLDVNKLAQLNVAGGNIRNIALNAAFLAANSNEAVQMSHVLRAASTEYAKLEKPLTEAEIGGWL